MNIKWSRMSGFGPSAWNLGNSPMGIPESYFHPQKDAEEMTDHRTAGAQNPQSTPCEEERVTKVGTG